MKTRFEEMLDNYVYYIQKLTNEYYAKFPNLEVAKITIRKGRKYMKVTKVSEGMISESVHSFVEVETGNVYKAASWRAPAKHVRANIYDYNSLKNGVNEHGANYIVR